MINRFNLCADANYLGAGGVGCGGCSMAIEMKGTSGGGGAEHTGDDGGKEFRETVRDLVSGWCSWFWAKLALRCCTKNNGVLETCPSIDLDFRQNP